MSYKIAVGHVDPSTMSDADPQPKTNALFEGVVKETADGGKIRDGYMGTEWEFTVLTPAQLDALLTQMNVASNEYYDITISTRVNNDRSFSNFYGTVHRPNLEDAKFEFGLWRGVIIQIKRMTAV